MLSLISCIPPVKGCCMRLMSILLIWFLQLAYQVKYRTCMYVYTCDFSTIEFSLNHVAWKYCAVVSEVFKPWVHNSFLSSINGNVSEQELNEAVVNLLSVMWRNASVNIASHNMKNHSSSDILIVPFKVKSIDGIEDDSVERSKFFITVNAEPFFSHFVEVEVNGDESINLFIASSSFHSDLNGITLV